MTSIRSGTRESPSSESDEPEGPAPARPTEESPSPTAVPEPLEARAEAVPRYGHGVVRRSRSRSASSRSARAREGRIRTLRLTLGFAGVVFFLTVVVMSGYIANLATENDDLVAALNRSDRRAAELETRLQQIVAHRDELVADRIPGLRPLEYDQAITLEQDYVRNVIFTLARDGEETRQEYRVVLHNDSLSVIHPDVKIVLFDEVGIQIGLATIERVDASTETHRTLLDPGEVRSYSGTISMLTREAPRYFLVVVG